MSSARQEDIYRTAGFGVAGQRGCFPAILVVDFSYGFTDPIYPTAADMSAEIEATKELINIGRAMRFPIVFTTISYTPGELEMLPWLRKATGMASLVAGSRLVEIDQRLEPRATEPIIIKHGASAFHGTNLAAMLNGAGVDTVIVTGATTSGCVRASVVDAVQYGFNVLVPEGCVADRSKPPHDANLFDIQQKYADVVQVSEAMNYLRSCGNQRTSTR
ncbi:isochorismatase family protein [Limibacillus halophilus]|uniref:Nicotinamidase-related amidase n=1 Tax=Limibacillus halophilus TaxID=1579333 RepID=A0A839ST31_9PROT|nr:isochorismatase family protein [Limibacillus halophilus]MBB3064506.1 nicotinamidase-related amidase [Limibacillus halophilus]